MPLTPSPPSNLVLIISSNLSRVQVTKSPDDFLLVQITGCRFYASDILHLLVVSNGVIFAYSHYGTGSRFQFVKFERLHKNPT